VASLCTTRFYTKNYTSSTLCTCVLHDSYNESDYFAINHSLIGLSNRNMLYSLWTFMWGESGGGSDLDLHMPWRNGENLVWSWYWMEVSGTPGCGGWVGAWADLHKFGDKKTSPNQDSNSGHPAHNTVTISSLLRQHPYFYTKCRLILFFHGHAMPQAVISPTSHCESLTVQPHVSLCKICSG